MGNNDKSLNHVEKEMGNLVQEETIDRVLSESTLTSSSTETETSVDSNTVISIEDIVTPEVVSEIFEKYDRGLNVRSYKVKLGTKAGDNYMSTMYSVDVIVRDIRTDTDETIKIMFKAMPRNPMRVLMIQEAQVFVKEVRMYNEILPLIAVNTIFTAYPKCYYAHHDGKTDYLALENLKPYGFKMNDRHKGLDFKHIKLVTKELAKFHALSFLRWNGKGEEILAGRDYLKETFWKPQSEISEIGKLFVDGTFPQLASLLHKRGQIEFAKRVLLVKQNDIFRRMNKLTSVSLDFPNVINHGDCWNNNLLFKYDQNGVPIETKLVDFQVSKVGPRCLDLAYLAYSSFTIEALNTKINDFLKLYHETFIETIKKIGVEDLTFNGNPLTFEYLVEEWNALKSYGMTLSLMLLPAMCANSDDVPDMETLKPEDFTSDPETTGAFTGMLTNSKTLIVRLENLAKYHLPQCFKQTA